VNYFYPLVALLSLGACRPAVERLYYEKEKEQILFLYSPDRETQIFYRTVGQEANWVATASSTMEREPPASGPWLLQFPDWVVVHARNSELQADTSGCVAREAPLALRAKGFSLEPCAGEDVNCCVRQDRLFIGPGGRCRAQVGWSDEPGLCVSRRL